MSKITETRLLHYYVNGIDTTPGDFKITRQFLSLIFGELAFPFRPLNGASYGKAVRKLLDNTDYNDSFGVVNKQMFPCVEITHTIGSHRQIYVRGFDVIPQPHLFNFIIKDAFIQINYLLHETTTMITDTMMDKLLVFYHCIVRQLLTSEKLLLIRRIQKNFTIGMAFRLPFQDRWWRQITFPMSPVWIEKFKPTFLPIQF